MLQLLSSEEWEPPLGEEVELEDVGDGRGAPDAAWGRSSSPPTGSGWRSCVRGPGPVRPSGHSARGVEHGRHRLQETRPADAAEGRGAGGVRWRMTRMNRMADRAGLSMSFEISEAPCGSASTIPAILLLWVLKPRRPRLRVPSLMLWPGSPAERQSARPWQRLRNHPLAVAPVRSPPCSRGAAHPFCPPRMRAAIWW